MRLLHVRGAGLASLAAPFHVDLTDPIIRNTGLFMISGPTGAGKSTVLDAIMLALFDRFPRVEGDSADREIGSEADDNIERATAPSAILTRGLGFGYAEVEFIGADSIHYRARWEIHRARKKATGDLQDSKRSLSRVGPDGAEQPIAGTKKDIAAAVERALGLTYEQFTRTVLLAQNHFDAFLTADEKKRAELLEKITGEDIYARISQHVHKLTTEKRSALVKVQERADMVALLTPEQIAATNSEQVDLKSAITSFQTAEQVLTAAKTWWETDKRCSASLSKTTAELDTTQQQLSDLEPLRDDLARTRNALTVVPHISAMDATKHDVENARVALTETQTSLEQATAAKTEVQRAVQTATDTLTATEQANASFQPLWDKAVDLDRRIELARNNTSEARSSAETAQANETSRRSVLKEMRKTEASWKAGHDQAQSELELHAAAKPLLACKDEILRAFTKRTEHLAAHDTLAKQLDVAVASLARIAETIATTTASHEATAAKVARLIGDLAPLQEEFSRGNLAQIYARHRDATALDSRLAGTESIITAAQAHCAAIANASAKRDEFEQEKARGSQALADCDARLTLLECRLDEAETARKSFEAALSDDAQRFRSDLREGEPCPVCGSRDHPLHDPALAAALTPLKERIATLIQEKSEVTTRAANARATIRTCDSGLTSLDQVLPAEQRKCDACLQRWRGAVGELPSGIAPRLQALQPETLEAAETLTNIRHNLADTITSLTQACKHLEALSLRIAELSKDRDAAIAERDALAETMRKQEQDAAKARESTTEFKAKLDAVQDSIASLDANLLFLLSPLAINQESLAADPHVIRQQVVETTDIIATAQARLTEAQVKLAPLASEIAAVKASLGHAEDVLAQAKASAGSASIVQIALEQERAPLLDGEASAIHRARHSDLFRASRDNLETAKGHFSAADLALTAASGSLQNARNTLEAATQRQQRAATALAEALEEKSLNEALARELQQRGVDWVSVSEISLREAEDAVTAARRAHADTIAGLEAHLAKLQPELSASVVASELSKLAAQRDTALTRLGEVRHHLKKDQEERDRHTGIVNEIGAARAVCNTWDAVNLAIGSADGNKFRRFAQSHTFEVLLDLANDQLRLLAPRYRLSQAPAGDLALQVIDQDMGEEVRGARSLSGGERFLVSLALALALSTLGAGKSLTETLFIDEGFGSLDPESLDLALEGLDALRSQGRTVGVISHVEAMKDRIPVQILVEKQGGGRSTVRLLLLHQLRAR